MAAVGGEDVEAWFRRRVPTDWFTQPPEVRADRDEIVVVGALPPDGETDDGRDAEAAVLARVQGFRERTRQDRVVIATEAEHLFERKVSWGVLCGGTRVLFTTLGVPVMTRLRMGERAVLDTLIESGVARSRSEALAWCVRLVARNEGPWLAELREALEAVADVREAGPRSTR